jgi:hypothetical protein
MGGPDLVVIHRSLEAVLQKGGLDGIIFLKGIVYIEFIRYLAVIGGSIITGCVILLSLSNLSPLSMNFRATPVATKCSFHTPGTS